MRKPALSRRDWLALGAVSAGALALGHYLRRGVPLGDDVSARIAVAEMLDAPGYPVEGNPAAPIAMLVFSDYACAVCRRVEPWWREAVAEAGDVRVVHRDWPVLGPASRRAARVALATQYQGLYARYHAELIRTGRLDEGALRAALSRVGGLWPRLEADLAIHGEAIDALLARTALDAVRLGFRGTPGYLIGPIRIEGGASTRQFADAIERARKSLSP